MLLVVTPNYRGEVKLLAETAEVLGHKIYNGGWRIPDHLIGMPGAVYGEQLFCEVVAQQMNWTLLNNPLNWLAKLPEEYVNRKINFGKLSDFRNITVPTFVKPADDKAFPAKVYDSGEDIPTNPILDDVPTLTSEVMKFTSEYRCFIKNGVVTTASCYWCKHHNMPEALINNPAHYLDNNDAVINFVNKLLQDERVSCVPGSVIDVGRFKKDTYTVIESNPVYASGIYGCELVAVLDSIKAACISNE